MNKQHSILIIEDDNTLSDAISLNLNSKGYLTQSVENAENGIRAINKNNFDVVICDLKLPGIDGISFIKKIRKTHPYLTVILTTGYGDNELAIQALKAGAYDYLSKPFEIDELILTLKKIEERNKLREENLVLRSEIQEKYNFSNIVAKSQVMQNIFETVKRLSNFDTTVLIRGESGTGKELIAKAIHLNSPRKNKPFVAVNCGAIPENLMESEFFGYIKGAFTGASSDKVGLFEEANGGTIFLDEIGEMPKHLQVKLLRVLQEQEIQRVGDEKVRAINVRVIAATLKNLEEETKNHNFREDLLYRLNVIRLDLPPLRERMEDVPVLIDFFREKFNKKLKLKIKQFPPQVIEAILNYSWRGNVRELENCIERVMVLSENEIVKFHSLPQVVQEAFQKGINSQELYSDESLSIKKKVKALEKSLIIKALERTNGNKSQASKLLEISHRALLYKLKDYKLTD